MADQADSLSADEDEIQYLRRRIQALQDDVGRADEHLRVLLRQRPFLALAVAAAAGFVIGRVIGRS